jgi:anaerobic magnesium-protoporphyrin IX monomethyl ester cyclase
MRLLLTHGYFLEEDSKEQAVMKPYAPLGLLYLSSHLRGKGFDVDVYDSTFGSRAELFRLLEDGPRGVLGIYGNLMTRGNVLAIARHAKTCGWRVVLGGPEPANYAAEYLAAGADLIVPGEGELVLERLMAADPACWKEVPGAVYRAENGSVVRNPAAPLISDLDAQPWPDRERIDIPKYLATWRAHHGRGSVSVITARGCPYHCNWCSHSVYGKTHRRRSPHAVVDEVEWILRTYNPEMLWMADDVFTIHHGWLFEYAAEMRRRGIRIPFECITRADRLNARVAETLAESGCFRVWIGSESGSQRILDAMQRGVTVEQVRSAVGMAKARGMETGMFLMWGYEGEELPDIEATVEHVRDCRPDVFFTTVSYAIRGTPYYERVKPRLVNIAPWETATDRDAKIQGRHSRNFYRHADELLRSTVAEGQDSPAARSARSALHAAAQEVEA